MKTILSLALLAFLGASSQWPAPVPGITGLATVDGIEGVVTAVYAEAVDNGAASIWLDSGNGNGSYQFFCIDKSFLGAIAPGIAEDCAALKVGQRVRLEADLFWGGDQSPGCYGCRPEFEDFLVTRVTVQ